LSSKLLEGGKRRGERERKREEKGGRERETDECAICVTREIKKDRELTKDEIRARNEKEYNTIN